MEFRDDLDLASRLADLADGIAMRRFGASDLRVEKKPDGSPVSDADLEVERALRAILARERSRDAVLGEEFGLDGRASRRWIIDPIDGTASYVRGGVDWAIQVALAVDGDPVVGVVSAPVVGRRWWAARGQGAFRVRSEDGDERRLSVSATDALTQARLALGELAATDDLREPWSRLREACGELAAGSGTALLVASRRADLGVMTAGGAWDLAGMAVLLEEAGGRITDLDGRRRLDCSVAFVSNGVLHRDALAVLSGAPSG